MMIPHPQRLRWILGLTLLAGLGLSLALPALARAGQSTKDNPAASANAIIYVAKTGDGSDGSSWAQAYTELQDALAAAESSDQIWVATGVYYPDQGSGQSNDDRASTFTLKSGVEIYGGFDPASGADLFEERDWQTFSTVLSGDIGEDDTTDSNGVVTDPDDIKGDNAYHVVTSSSVDSSAVLDGFYITAGQTNWLEFGLPCGPECGSGMFNRLSSPILNNVTFSGNEAGSGGGMYNSSSNPALTDVTFSNNSAIQGGGIFNYDSNPVLTNVTFTGNTANDDGGGMFNRLSSPILNDVTFTGNTASDDGGGIYTDNEFLLIRDGPMLQNIFFISNTASDDGGGMYNHFVDNLILLNANFHNNEAGQFGGGLANDESTPTLISVDFVNNHAGNAGGGLFNRRSDALLTNVYFTANSAISGGGINNYFSDPSLVNVTLAVNRASSTGGGVHNFHYSDASIDNSILWGNSPDQISQFDDPSVGDSSAIIRDSLVQGGCVALATCSGLLTGDPLFVRDPDPGADGDWGTSDDDYGDLQLKVGSPAINTGDNAHLPPDSRDLDNDWDTSETIPYDNAGNPRAYGGLVDLGAFEAQHKIEITQVIYVDDTATGANDGSSWSDAYTDLQDALEQATPGTQIQVAAGVYLPGTQADDTFQLKSGVALLGNFPDGGGEESERSFEHPSVLSGDIDGNDTTDPNGVVTDPDNLNGENTFHVIKGSGVDSSAVLDGFTITAGQAEGARELGGGMLNLSGSPTLANVTFSGNSAKIGGGMGNAINSSPTLTDVTFSGNRADRGGGMFNTEFSSPTLANVTFIGNLANSIGGGMRNELGSNPDLVNVNFDNNYAGSSGGGGMSNDDSNPTLINVEFNNNLASDSLPGLQNFDSDPQLNSILSPSDAADFGGGMNNWNSDPRLLNVTFAGNKSGTLGGGMFNYNSNALLINVIFSGNTADSGGGIYNSDSDPELLNVTFSSNHAETTGGGVHNYNDSHPSIENSILWGNSPEQVFQEDTSSAAIQDSLVQSGCPDAATCSGTLLTDDPLFVRNPGPGTDGVLGTSDDDYGDLQLKVGSPAINAGNNALLPADSWDLDGDGDTSEPIPYDFAYKPRITDATVDMGALEATETIYKVYLPLTVR